MSYSNPDDPQPAAAVPEMHDKGAAAEDLIKWIRSRNALSFVLNIVGIIYA